MQDAWVLADHLLAAVSGNLEKGRIDIFDAGVDVGDDHAIGALLDCHSNWTAAWFLMKRDGKDTPDCTVTADFHVKLFRPTPSDALIHLKARVVESREDRATVEAELIANDKVCATCRGTFVAVKEGHPAYHRW